MKLCKLLLVFILSLSLFGCNAKIDNKICEEFDTFVDSLLNVMFESDDTSINQFFTNPSSLPFEREIAAWDFYNTEDYLLSVKENEEVYKELLSFNYKKLDKNRQITYDILEYAFKDIPFDIDDKAYYYLDNNPLGQYNGIITDIPLILYFYNLNDEIDLKSYLNLMYTLDDLAYNLLSFEKERQDNGYGMTKDEIEAVIINIQDVLKIADFDFMINDFTSKLDNLSIDSNIKQEYRVEVVNNLEKLIINFYKILLEGLKVLEIKQRNEITLYDVLYGKEYYASLVYLNSGFSNMKDYENYLDMKLEESIYELIDLMQSDIDIDSLFDEDTIIHNTDNMNEILEYLKNEMYRDFPEVPDVNYDMVVLPEALQAILAGVGAFYLIGPVDSNEVTQKMMMNGDYQQSDFSTIAHEGYPGHMYQHVYANQLEIPLIRKLLSFSDYTEGYANYVQRYSSKYADNSEIAEALVVYNNFVYYSILKYDFMMHYEGENIASDFAALYGYEENDPEFEPIIEQLEFAPAAFVEYYIAGAIFDDLYLDVLDKTDGKISDKEYHENILKYGNIPLNLLIDYIYEEYNIN